MPPALPSPRPCWPPAPAPDVGGAIDCILGQSWLARQSVEIDYPARRLRFPRPGGGADPATGCLEEPKRFWMADDLMPIVVVQVNGRDVAVSLDTGSSGVLKLFSDAAARAVGRVTLDFPRRRIRVCAP